MRSKLRSYAASFLRARARRLGMRFTMLIARSVLGSSVAFASTVHGGSRTVVPPTAADVGAGADNPGQSLLQPPHDHRAEHVRLCLPSITARGGGARPARRDHTAIRSSLV